MGIDARNLKEEFFGDMDREELLITDATLTFHRFGMDLVELYELDMITDSEIDELIALYESMKEIVISIEERMTLNMITP